MKSEEEKASLLSDSERTDKNHEQQGWANFLLPGQLCRKLRQPNQLKRCLLICLIISILSVSNIGTLVNSISSKDEVAEAPKGNTEYQEKMRLGLLKPIKDTLTPEQLDLRRKLKKQRAERKKKKFGGLSDYEIRQKIHRKKLKKERKRKEWVIPKNKIPSTTGKPPTVSPQSNNEEDDDSKTKALMKSSTEASFQNIRNEIMGLERGRDNILSREWKPASSEVSSSSVSKLTDAEYKALESLYSERRQRVSQVCQDMKNADMYGNWKKKPLDRIRTNTMMFVEDKEVAYCAIPKVASSTWSQNFMILGGYRPLRKSIVAATKRLALPRNETPESAFERATSIIFVRHPMSRLASAYFQKFIDMGLQQWSKVRRFIIRKYRPGYKTVSVKEEARMAKQFYEYIEDNPVYPKPDEFLQFVLSGFKIQKLDPHWLPQHLVCPVCRLNFTIYSKIESMTDDVKYFLHKADIPDGLLAIDRPNVNPSLHGGSDKDKRFWSKVQPATLAQILFRFRHDFSMFDYSAADYMQRLGLKVDLEEAFRGL